MVDALSVSAAAGELNLNPARVRALIASGALSAEKIGGVWLVDRASVAGRKRRQTSPGRPLAPANAWALLLLASGSELPSQLAAPARWRVRQALRVYGLEALIPRLERRAEPIAYWALPGEMRALHERGEIVLSGASAAAAYEIGLVGSDAVDAYAPAGFIASLERAHGLQRVPGPESNVVLRAVPDEAWVLDGLRFAPAAAVALDLCSYSDPRARRAGASFVANVGRAYGRG